MTTKMKGQGFMFRQVLQEQMVAKSSKEAHRPCQTALIHSYLKLHMCCKSFHFPSSFPELAGWYFLSTLPRDEAAA